MVFDEQPLTFIDFDRLDQLCRWTLLGGHPGNISERIFFFVHFGSFATGLAKSSCWQSRLKPQVVPKRIDQSTISWPRNRVPQYSDNGMPLLNSQHADFGERIRLSVYSLVYGCRWFFSNFHTTLRFILIKNSYPLRYLRGVLANKLFTVIYLYRLNPRFCFGWQVYSYILYQPGCYFCKSDLCFSCL